MMDDIPFVIPPAPMPLPLMHPGHYGISYDIYTRATEDDLPHGWHSHRINTYRQLIRILNVAGFHHMQYSDYSRPNVHPAFAWLVMLSLCAISPPGKLESTVRGMKMHQINDDVCIVTQDVQLGGVHAQALRGPTPRQLVTDAAAALMHPAPEVLAVAPPMPQYTRPSQASVIAANWMQ
jgi:hypothetical protein